MHNLCRSYNQWDLSYTGAYGCASRVPLVQEEMHIPCCRSVCTWVCQQQIRSQVSWCAQSKESWSWSSLGSVSAWRGWVGTASVLNRSLLLDSPGHWSCAGMNMDIESGQGGQVRQRMSSCWTVVTPTGGYSCIFWHSFIFFFEERKQIRLHSASNSDFRDLCVKGSQILQTLKLCFQLALKGGQVIRAANNLCCSKHFRASLSFKRWLSAVLLKSGLL